jgi:uncharacterized protein YkwD
MNRPRRRGPAFGAALAAMLVVASASCAAAATSSRTPPAARPDAALPVPTAAYAREEAVELTPLERDIVARVRAEAGDPVQSSPSLARAARVLAAAASDGAVNPLGRSQLRAALASAGAFDPAPVAHLASGPPSALAAMLASRATDHELTHVGAGVAIRGDTAWAVLLTSRRSVSLDPFPRALPPGSEATLRGELSGLRAPRVVVTRPDGAVQEVGVEGDRRFSTRLRFEEAGRYEVEVLASGATGPEVVGLLAIDVGDATPRPLTESFPEEDPDALADAEARVEAAVNELRRKHSLPPLRVDPALREVARSHSSDMLSAGRVAHVLPRTGDVAARLRRARIPFDRVLENVARAASGLAAHGAAEDSPAHRGAMLDPAVRVMACGLARGALPSGEPVVYLTEIFVEPPASSDVKADVAGATSRIHSLLRSRRAALGRPVLARDAELDELAAEAARSMLRRGSLAVPPELNSEALLLPARSLAAAEAFVASDVGDAARSRHLHDQRFRRVGAGVAIGDSARYGAQRLWLVLVFTD